MLVFEYITGGGLIGQPLPASLLQEAYLMRNALLDDLMAVNNIDVLILQDERVERYRDQDNAELVCLTIYQSMDLHTFLQARQSAYDVVWLIAPETDDILSHWCQFFTWQGKALATCARQAVEICQDKLATSKRLQYAAIPSVPSRLFKLSADLNTRNCVLKVNGSVGCDEVYRLESEQHWQQILAGLDQTRQYIIQPYITGKALSLSCLFYQGKAYFICCNEQHVLLQEQKFVLSACTVNVQTEKKQQYQHLCQKIANAIPQLFGFVGIDFIQTDTGDTLILEINPRLTTSYAGIYEALGLNIAECIVDMLKGKTPILQKTRNKPVLINIMMENNDVRE